MKKETLASFKSRVRDRRAHVAVIGLGYVGLPLAVEFAQAGFFVTGIDVDEKKVEGVNGGVSHIADVDSGELKPLVETGHLRATADFGVLEAADAVSICVPTPLRKTKDPDISYIVQSAGKAISAPESRQRQQTLAGN